MGVLRDREAGGRVGGVDPSELQALERMKDVTGACRCRP